MSTESVQVTQHLLGLEPYVLLTFRNGGEGPDDLRIGIEFGGGVDDVRTALLLTLAQLDPPLSSEEIELLTRSRKI